jgi:hypothetical protein
VQVIADWFGQIPPNPYADNPDNPAISSIRVDPKTPVATHMCHFLGPHTDTCWRQTLIGLLLMHCLKAHPQGGRSLLVDGYTVASRLRETAAEAFRLLSSVPLNFGAKVEDLDDWRVLGRVISLAADGVIEGVRYNGNSIGQLELPAELIAPMYAALESFEAVLYDQSLWWQPLLQPGDALVIDNHRVLHGRHAFDPDLGDRHLQTCNVDRDDFHNRYRRFAKRMGSSRWNQRFTAGVICGALTVILRAQITRLTVGAITHEGDTIHNAVCGTIVMGRIVLGTTIVPECDIVDPPGVSHLKLR